MDLVRKRFSRACRRLKKGRRVRFAIFYRAFCSMIVDGVKVVFNVECVSNFIESRIAVFTIALYGIRIAEPQKLHLAKYLDLDFYGLPGTIAHFQSR